MGRVHITETIQGYENAMAEHWKLYVLAFVLFFGGIFFWWILRFAINFNPGIFLIIAGVVVFLIARSTGKGRRRKYRF